MQQRQWGGGEGGQDGAEQLGSGGMGDKAVCEASRRTGQCGAEVAGQKRAGQGRWG